VATVVSPIIEGATGERQNACGHWIFKEMGVDRLAEHVVSVRWAHQHAAFDIDLGRIERKVRVLDPLSDPGRLSA
jgi:hypothetical protein